MIADIASGKTGFADIMFLVALIVFLLAGFIAYEAKTFYATLMALGLAVLSLGWLVL